MTSISPSERAAIAEEFGVSGQYLYQCIVGIRSMDTGKAVRLERDSGGRIRRWHLRVNDWWEHWPELINTPGAPPVPTLENAAREAA